MSTAAGMPVRHILSISGGKPAPCYPAFDMFGSTLTRHYPKSIVGDSMWHSFSLAEIHAFSRSGIKVGDTSFNEFSDRCKGR